MFDDLFVYILLIVVILKHSNKVPKSFLSHFYEVAGQILKRKVKLSYLIETRQTFNAIPGFTLCRHWLKLLLQLFEETCQIVCKNQILKRNTTPDVFLSVSVSKAIFNFLVLSCLYVPTSMLAVALYIANI